MSEAQYTELIKAIHQLNINLAELRTTVEHHRWWQRSVTLAILALAVRAIVI